MKIFSVIVAVLVFWYLVVYIGWFNGYSEGQRTGDVFKFSKKGLIWKSWEGEMYLGGIRSTGGESPRLELEKFYFSIPKNQEKDTTEWIEKLQECSKKRLNCTIVYKQWLKHPIYQDTSYTVEKVELSN